MAPRARATPPARKRPPAKKAAARKPVWKEVEEREARRPTARARTAAKGRRRLAIDYDIDGPHVRLGIVWFVAEMASAVAGVVGIAVLFALTAAVAAMQTAQCWRREGQRPDRQVAGAAAAVLVLAAAVTTGFLGIALIGATAVTVFLAFSAAAVHRRLDPVAMSGQTVRCWLFVGFAAACVIVTARFSLGSAIALMLLAAAYETGDYLVGSGAANPYEGPVAGATAILVLTFAITAVGVRPFTFPDSFALGAMAAVLCPLGQLAGSLILPRFDAPASALRRLDSLLLLAPAWALVVGILVK